MNLSADTSQIKEVTNMYQNLEEVLNDMLRVQVIGRG